MAMEKSHEQIKKENGAGHNSKHIEETLQEMAVQYAKCDEASMELNDKRKKIRDTVADLGIDTKAWQDEIGRMKRDVKKKDGYDEAVKVIRAAFKDMIAEDLFAHVAKKEKEKEEIRNAKIKEREDAKAAKPKKATGKDAAAGEGLSTGEAQAQHLQKHLN